MFDGRYGNLFTLESVRQTGIPRPFSHNSICSGIFNSLISHPSFFFLCSFVRSSGQRNGRNFAETQIRNGAPPAKGTKKLKGTLFFAGFLREKFDISRIPLYCSKLRFIAGIVRDHEKRGELFSWWNSVAISPWHRRTGSESDTAIPRSKQSVFFSSFRHFRHAPCSRPPQRRFFPALRQTLHTYMARPWQSNNKGGIAHA